MSACVGRLPAPVQRGIQAGETAGLILPALVPRGLVLAFVPQHGVETAIVTVGRVVAAIRRDTAR
jgi:hypothetical protein